MKHPVRGLSKHVKQLVFLIAIFSVKWCLGKNSDYQCFWWISKDIHIKDCVFIFVKDFKSIETMLIKYIVCDNNWYLLW